MKALKDRLIKLGAARKDLRPHIRPVLAELDKQAGNLRVDFGGLSTEFRDVEWSLYAQLGEIIKKEVNRRLARMGEEVLEIKPKLDSTFGTSFDVVVPKADGSGTFSMRAPAGRRAKVKDVIDHIVDMF